VVYGGVHNPAARLSDPSDDSYCCADPNTCTCGYAYPRADANTNSAIHTGRNRFEYGFDFANSYADSYSHAYAHTYADTCNPHDYTYRLGRRF
jgi:hypothetical protein